MYKETVMKPSEILPYVEACEFEHLAEAQAKLTGDIAYEQGKAEGIRTNNRELLATVEAMFPELKQTYWQSKRWQAFLKEQSETE